MDMLGSRQGSPPAGAGISAPSFHTPEPLPSLTQRQSGQRASPLSGPSLPHQHQDELLLCEEGFLPVLCEMENTRSTVPPTCLAWVHCQHLQPGNIGKQRGKT